MIDLKLPLLGDVMQEGTLVEWLLPDGAAVARGQPLYRLETDKVSLDVESPDSGELEQLAAAGSTVPVGAVVGRLRQGAPPPTIPAGGVSGGSRASAAAPGSSEAGEATSGASAAQLSAPLAADLAGPRATPAARRVARELGIRLEDVQATGERIHETDVRALNDQRAAGTHALAGGAQLTGRRAVIAEHMLASVREMAQLTISLEVDVTACAALREQLAKLWQTGPSYTDLVLLATARALRDHPALNATLEDGRLRHCEHVDIGLAVDAPEGLIVPIIRQVDRLTLPELMAESRRLSERARANRLTLDELHGGTFSITTLGALGIDFFTPIINPPQVAILGIGRAFSKLALVNGAVQERRALYLNLSFDHRAVDGAPAARFLNRVKDLLELPAGLLTSQGMNEPPLTSSTAPMQ